MEDARISIPREAIADFCLRNGISRFALFGSVLRDDFGPESDVDVLVEFLPGRTPGLAFFRMQDDLSEMLGRTVDLNTRGFLGRRIIDEVLAEARDVYVAA